LVDDAAREEVEVAVARLRNARDAGERGSQRRLAFDREACRAIAGGGVETAVGVDTAQESVAALGEVDASVAVDEEPGRELERRLSRRRRAFGRARCAGAGDHGQLAVDLEREDSMRNGVAEVEPTVRAEVQAVDGGR